MPESPVIDKQYLLDSFLRYTAIDTQSDPGSETIPSTPGQLEFAHMLAGEMRSMGLREADVDTHGYVTATLPSNADANYPVIGLIAHLDTSPDASGKNVRALVHERFNGEKLVLNESEGIILDSRNFPEIRQYRGQTIITSDGKTLLGADNKGGIAVIMTALRYLTRHPAFRHVTVKVCFTPDEEIGRGVDRFDVKRFGADFAYTIDGGELGELQFENFNAAFANIRIKGRNIHPGEAMGKMINACHVGMELNGLLPKYERPENTSEYKGFFHLTSFRATVEDATMEYIIRDHDTSAFESKKAMLRHIIGQINHRYGQSLVQLEMKDQYYNMRSKILPVYHIVELARQAMEYSGVKPRIRPVRGGTDGARLSHMGLPCPNIFCGGHNYHGRYEYIPLESMEKAVHTILHLLRLATCKFR